MFISMKLSTRDYPVLSGCTSTDRWCASDLMPLLPAPLNRITVQVADISPTSCDRHGLGYVSFMFLP